MEISGFLALIFAVFTLLGHGIGFRRGLRVGIRRGRAMNRNRDFGGN